MSKMRVAILQPYLFPYYLYWRLIRRADLFVIFDNVNFKKKGYINRNYSFIDGTRKRFNLELQKASQNKLISEIDICKNQKKLRDFLQNQYKNTHNFNHVFPMLEEILSCNDLNLALFLENSIKKICSYLDIQTPIVLASSLQAEYHDLNGQGKILSLCRLLGANEYLNLPGGRELYDKFDFKRNNIRLNFIDPLDADIIPSQVNNKRECSIIDLIMNVSQNSLVEFFGHTEIHNR